LQAAQKEDWLSSYYVAGLVSVIIPTYNRKLLLQEAIQSVVNQIYRPIECIVIDDGSADGTKELMNQYMNVNDNSFTLRYQLQKNAGAQVARNNGTILCRGEFIQYLDSDDLIYPEKIYSQVNYLHANPRCDGVFGNWRTGEIHNNELVTAYAKKDLIDQILTDRCIHTLSFLMRRSLINKIGPWDVLIRRNQEIDFHLRGLLKGANYHYDSIETGLHRIHSFERITTNTGTKEILAFFQKWEQLLIANKKFTGELKKKFARLYVWFFLLDIKPGATNIQLLADAMRLDPKHDLFSSKKLQSLKKIIGTKPALRLWLRWFIYNKNKQAAFEK
jgi:glycosyltransferase involved in cell wall biosynthesis